jgi:hypothetical protein
VLGRDKGSQQNFGQLCVSCAYLALNGTTNGGGSVTTPSVPGTTTPVLQLPLNASNALDVFNLLGSNRTSAAVRAALTDSAQLQVGDQSLTNFFGTVTGTLGSAAAVTRRSRSASNTSSTRSTSTFRAQPTPDRLPSRRSKSISPTTVT